MPRKFSPLLCANPDCGEMFIPRRRDHVYCVEGCRVNFNNDKRAKKNQTDYALEKVMRQNEKILKKVILSPFYSDDTISINYLQHERFDFNVASDTTKNKKTGGIIRWCHTHGIEPKPPGVKNFTIRKREKIR